MVVAAGVAAENPEAAAEVANNIIENNPEAAAQVSRGNGCC